MAARLISSSRFAESHFSPSRTADDMATVNIRSSTGTNNAITDVDINGTVAAFKAQIATALSVPVEQQSVLPSHQNAARI